MFETFLVASDFSQQTKACVPFATSTLFIQVILQVALSTAAVSSGRVSRKDTPKCGCKQHLAPGMATFLLQFILGDSLHTAHVPDHESRRSYRLKMYQLFRK